MKMWFTAMESEEHGAEQVSLKGLPCIHIIHSNDEEVQSKLLLKEHWGWGCMLS